MLKHLAKWTSNSITLFPHPTTFSSVQKAPSFISPSLDRPLKIRMGGACGARRRVIRDDDGDGDDDDEDYGYNEELAMLESYSELAKDEILLVEAVVDEEQVEVIIFKGFSSCLSYRTSSNPSTSVLPAKAEVKSIDRARGPFDPSNIQYIERGLTFHEFTTRFSPSTNL